MTSIAGNVYIAPQFLLESYMDRFCAKCGAELSAGTKFCTACGAPTSPAVQPVTPAGQGPAAVAQAPAKSSGALKIILIVIGIFVGLGVLTAALVIFGVWRVSKAVHVDRSGSVTISTPEGRISAGQTPAHVTEAEVGAPIYPGAVSAEGGIKFGAASGSMATYVFMTSDSVQQVLAFYRGKFGPKATVMETPSGAMVTSAKSDNEGTLVTIGHDDSDGKTSIMITHTISTKNQ
ncbi:MAG: zinc-ribbon domain-containing protein [Candidatus Acidiferrales bacterium]